MIALYSDSYLKSLWTVYELATFLLLFPQGRLQVQPMYLAKAVFVITMLVWCGHQMEGLYWHPWVQAQVAVLADDRPLLTRLTGAFLVETPIFLSLSFVMLHWAREQVRIRETVKAFSIRKATCLDEEDRNVVESNIASFAIYFGIADYAEGQGKNDILT